MAKPTITGPIRGGERGWPFGAYFGDIRELGYIEEEYFIEGEAKRYVPVGELGRDGKWKLAEREPGRYKTRLLVRRPANSAQFNGSVVVEWTNVSAGYDIAFMDPPGLYEDGFAYVAMSAQMLGLDGFPSNPRGLHWWDPERYSTLLIPDEGVCYDIFTQCAKALRGEFSGADPMGGLKAKWLIGVGASQSGTRIQAYANGVQPLEKSFDALIAAVNAGTGSDFDDPRAHPDRAAGERGHSRNVNCFVRDDLDIPVLAINTETEAVFQAMNRQPDSKLFHSWEVAGAAHLAGNHQRKLRCICGRDGMRNPYEAPAGAGASEVDWLGVLDAGIHHLHAQLNGGPPPPSAAPMEMDAEQRDVARDEYGNAKGGARLPEVEVPIARYTAGLMLRLAGFTIPFKEAQLKTLYPTHQDYVQKVAAAAEAAQQAGFIIPSRAEEYRRAAEAAPVPELAMPDLTPKVSQNI